MQKNLIAVALVAAVVCGGGGFYGGMQYQKNQAPTVNQQGQGRGAGRAGLAGGAGGQIRGGFGGTAGEVLSKDDKSFTVKLRDGGSKVVFFSTSTRVGEMTDGKLDDVKTGANVTVMGTPNSDGSVTAQMVQIRPAGAPDFQRPNGGQPPQNP